MSKTLDASAIVTFLEECSKYFENLDTGGEDKAFWANVSNAEMCREIVKYVKKEDIVKDIEEKIILRSIYYQINITKNEDNKSDHSKKRLPYYINSMDRILGLVAKRLNEIYNTHTKNNDSTPPICEATSTADYDRQGMKELAQKAQECTEAHAYFDQIGIPRKSGNVPMVLIGRHNWAIQHRNASQPVDGKTYDAVHQEKGLWYFWDETQADRHGPYGTEQQARQMLGRYCLDVLNHDQDGRNIDPSQQHQNN